MRDNCNVIIHKIKYINKYYYKIVYKNEYRI